MDRSLADEVIQLLYDLTGPSANGSLLNTLDAYSYGENKELVFAFWEQEISATVSGDGEIVFDDVSQLSSLSAEDYLSFRLYTNNDPGNVLWEYAFGFPVLRVDLNRDGKITRQAKDRVSPKKPFRFWH